MKRATIIATGLFVAALVLLLSVVYTGFMGPQIGIKHRKEIEQRMGALRDQAKAHDRQALNFLIQALQSNDTFEQTAAAAYLGQVGAEAEPAVDALVNTLFGANLFAARESARSLGQIGPNANRAVPALIKAVQQYPNADVGWFAAESLGHVADPRDPEVVSVLEKAANSSDELMRNSATSALRTLKSRRT
jgi:HEAT repeat protein